MSTEVDEALVTKVDEAETDGSAIKQELTNVDVLVCGLCHIGFHFVEEFQEHKDGECKKVSAFRDQNTSDNKPQILGFLLWKNSQTKQIENEEAWKVYKMWCVLPETVRNCWIEAAKTIHSYDELAKTIPDKMIKLDTLPSSSNGSLDELPPALMKPSGEFPSGQEFVVERVVARRFNQKKRQFEYLLKWEGYPPEQNTWEPADNMSACSHLIKQYEDSLVKNGTASTPGKRAGPGRPRKIEQIQNIGVVKPKVSPQAQVEQIGIAGRPVRSSKQKAMDQVKYWCGTMKATEEVIESKPSQPNILKRDYIMLEEDEEDEDTPVLKKKYFHPDSEDEDWDDPSLHKSNASISENEEPIINYGKIISRSQLTMEERIKYNVSRNIARPSAFPVLKREERVKKVKTHLAHFNNFHRNSEMGLLQISPHLTQVTLASSKGFVKLETNQVPLSGIYIYSNNEGFIRLNLSDKTHSMMLMMKNRDDPKKGKVVYADGAQALQPPKKTLDLSKARETVHQSSPLMKSYAKKPFVPPTKIQAAVKPRPFLHKVAAANPEYEKSLLQKHQGSPGMKPHHSNMTFVPRRTLNNRAVQQGAFAYNTLEQLEFWEDTASDTDDGGLSDHFPSEDVSIPPNSPNRPLTLCPTTGKRLMKAEGEKTPEPTPPSSPKTMITIDESSLMGRQHDNSSLPTIIKLEPGTGHLGNQNPMMSYVEPEKVNINRTPQMQHHQARQSFVNYKDIPAASNSGLRMKKTNSRPNNNSNKSLHVSSGISKSHSSLNVPARKIQQKQQQQIQQHQHQQQHHEQQITQPFPGQQAILTDESGRLILSADDTDSMITLTGDDGMLYQVSAAQLAASGGTVLLAGNEGDGQQCVYLADDNASIMQTNQNQEGMIALDDFGNTVGQLMPHQLDLGNLVTDDAGNMYMKDNETGQYVPVSATEQGGQVVIQTNENFTQEPQVMQEDPDQLVAQIVDAGEPTPGGGPRRVVLQLPDGNLMVTEMDEEQFAALEMDK
ncbi:uncharacterized protein LOC132946497 isoform X2 [Metopolophium dirhodum]|uniref:uncharacterized protein LOC132946497 isoform X2 n=1 Tax=Metopolophium dirhodum TaxID=44670 RepID=UPI00299009EF|nr:uncharacterized protein LOC132946497 isoform X2 [Metopolophium dirhodum]